MMDDPGAWKDLAHQAPALFIYAASAFAALRMFLSHLKTEGESSREVLRDLSTDMKANTTAIVGLTEAVRGAVRRG